jgi:hypothetical protein
MQVDNRLVIYRDVSTGPEWDAWHMEVLTRDGEWVPVPEPSRPWFGDIPHNIGFPLNKP